MLLEREWVTLRDPADDHRRYTFDVSFLLSDYTCIYGAGCPSVYPDEREAAIGCCLHGAYLTDEDDGDALTRTAVDELDTTLMQHHAAAVSDGVLQTDDDGEVLTRTIDDACIFLNRGGFDGGIGCALHHLANARGEHHLTYKPVVCWQVPLHRDIVEEVANDGATLETHTIAAFERGHWGDGGSEFGWWCLDDDRAFVGRSPVYRSMQVELRRMVGDEVYAELAAYLDRRRRQRGRVPFLPTV